MAKKRISAEERKEYKGGKYMGGPAEEKAEKKKPAKRMAMGGYTGPAGTNRGSWSGDGESLGVRTGKVTGSSEMNRPNMRGDDDTPDFKKVSGKPKMTKAISENMPPIPTAKPGLSYRYDTKLAPGMSIGNYMRNPTAMQTREGRTSRGLKGGGLARKGIGQALAKGGLVKGAGCCQRGMKKPRMK